MRSTPNNYQNGDIARLLVKQSLTRSGKVLATIGQPLYLLLAFIFSKTFKTLDALSEDIYLLRQKTHISLTNLKKESIGQKRKLHLQTLVLPVDKIDLESLNIFSAVTVNFYNYLKLLFDKNISAAFLKIRLSIVLAFQNFVNNTAKVINIISFSLKTSVLLKKAEALGQSPKQPKLVTKPVATLLEKNRNKATFSTINLSFRKLLYQLLKSLHLVGSDIVEGIESCKKAFIALKRIFTLRLTLILFGSLSSALLLAIFIGWFFVFRGLPSAKELASRKIEVSTKIYDRNGILLYKIFEDRNRSPVSLKEIPIQVVLATLAIEDAEFYSHPGFSIRGISRATIRNFQKGELTGGSTITQQLVKNALLSREKTFSRKIRELALAIQVERTYTKDQILEMYLNEVSYGGTAYGIQEAANMYFDKDVKDLTLGEAALIAGLPKSPSQFSPFGSHPEKAKDRQLQVLRLMQVNGYITEEQMNAAESEEIVYAPNRIDIKAPHFVMYVRELLEDKYGKEMVENGGLDVITTLDYRIQQIAEEVVKNEMTLLSKLNVSNGAVVILNPQTGEILAMVGSKDYFDTKADGNVNVTLALRQPGSSIKIVNYAYALSHGYTPATVLDDTPAIFKIQGQAPYTPKNYDGTYRGKISLRSALAESRNIPAVRVLESYGVSNMIDLGQKMGITSWTDSRRFGLSLTLGGGEVRLLDLAGVYATIANYGTHNDSVAIKEVKNYKGNILENFACNNKIQTHMTANNLVAPAEASASQSAVKAKEISFICGGNQAVDPRVAYMLTDILKDNEARSPAFGRNSQLIIPNHPEVAVKTGTSNDLRDNLTIGYTRDYAVAVWVGNNNNTPMSRVASGVTGASPIFNKIMTALLSGQEPKEWEVPSGLTNLPICMITGTLSCSGCPVKNEWFLEEAQPKNHCTNEWLEEIKRRLEEQSKVENNNNGNGNSNKPRRWNPYFLYPQQ